MSSSTKFLVTSLISYITGILTVTGHLDQTSQSNLYTGFQDIVGGILLIAPIVYNLEHHGKQATQPPQTKLPVSPSVASPIITTDTPAIPQG